MARTAIPVSALARNAGNTPGAATTIDATLVTNGAVIAATADFEKCVIRVANTAATDQTVTVLDGTVPGHGTSLAVTVPATNGIRDICVESGKFVQADGAVYVNFSTGMTGSIAVTQIP